METPFGVVIFSEGILLGVFPSSTPQLSRMSLPIDIDHDREFIDASELTLEEWLSKISVRHDDRDYSIIDYRFPTEEHRTEYLSTIEDRAPSEIEMILRLFLIPGGSLQHDRFLIKSWKEMGNIAEAVDKFDFARRLISTERTTWPGVTWILDLLPGFPKQAIDAVQAYSTAHIQFLPDGRISGLGDVSAIIRARYLEADNPREVLLDLDSRDFERLIGSLFAEMGYSVELTSESKDGGFDLRAERNKDGITETAIVECKRYQDKVGRPKVNKLNGVLNASDTQLGFLVTTAEFTKPAIEFAKECNHVTLVSYDKLNLMMNKYFGSNWPEMVDFHVAGLDRKRSIKTIDGDDSEQGT